MTYQTPASLPVLIAQAEEEQLYFKLIEQTNKDFTLANEILDAPSGIFPFEFTHLVQDKIHKLLQFKFDSFLNLLYIIDVSEEEIEKLDGTDLVKLSENVTFLVLKREWQKVWFRANY
jgi:hypothetical protein